MKAGFTVVAICLLIGSIGGAVMLWNTQTRIRESQDLVLGLTYFMEQHEGRLPASRDEFLASEFIESLTATDGRTPIRVKPYMGTRYRRDPHNITIEDLDAYQIAWGTDLTNLAYDAKGELRDPKGNTIKLLRWPGFSYGGGLPASARYGDLILAASRDIRGRTATQPAASAPTPK